MKCCVFQYSFENKADYIAVLYIHTEPKPLLENVFTLLSCGVNALIYFSSEYIHTKYSWKKIIIKTIENGFYVLKKYENKYGLTIPICFWNQKVKEED